jgi:hypothetical protein
LSDLAEYSGVSWPTADASEICTMFQWVLSQLTATKLTQVEYPKSMSRISQLQGNDVLIPWDSGHFHILVTTHLVASVCSKFIQPLLAVVACGTPIHCDQQFQFVTWEVNGLFEDIHLNNSDDDSLNRAIPSAVQYSLLHCESDDSKSWSTMVQFNNSATSVVDTDNLSELQQSSQSHLDWMEYLLMVVVTKQVSLLPRAVNEMNFIQGILLMLSLNIEWQLVISALLVYRRSSHNFISRGMNVDAHNMVQSCLGCPKMKPDSVRCPTLFHFVEISDTDGH